MNLSSKSVAFCLAGVGVCLCVVIVRQNQSLSRLRDENRALHDLIENLSSQSSLLTAENERLSKLATTAEGSGKTAPAQEPSNELLRLRGEVGRLRLETRDAEQSRGAEMQAAQAKIGAAEADLARLTTLRSRQVVSEQELRHAQFAVQILKAEASGDKSLASQIRLQQAEEELARAAELRKQSVISQGEYDQALHKVEILRAGTN